MRALLLGMITMLAACPLQKTTTLGGSSSPGGDSSARHSRFMPEDFAALLGLTVEQARAKAKQLGHTGQIDVSEAGEFIAGCTAGTVCEAEAGRGGDTMSFADGMILTVNRQLEIAPPPD